MKAGYTIAVARGEHVASLPDIERAAAAAFSDEDVPVSLRDETIATERLEAARVDGRLWVALDRTGDAVGFAFVDLVDAAAHLCEMDVAPDHARQGIGSALVEAIAAWATGRGLTALTLTTFAHLPWNAPFYEKLGFRTLAASEITSELARIRASEAAAGLDPDKRVVMRRELGPA